MFTLPNGSTTTTTTGGLITGGHSISANFGGKLAGYYRFKYTTGAASCTDESFITIEVIDQTAIPNVNSTVTQQVCDAVPTVNVVQYVGQLQSVTINPTPPANGYANGTFFTEYLTPNVMYTLTNVINRSPSYSTTIGGQPICTDCQYGTFTQVYRLTVVPTPTTLTSKQTAFCVTYTEPNGNRSVNIPISDLFNETLTSPIKI